MSLRVTDLPPPANGQSDIPEYSEVPTHRSFRRFRSRDLRDSKGREEKDGFSEFVNSEIFTVQINVIDFIRFRQRAIFASEELKNANGGRSVSRWMSQKIRWFRKKRTYGASVSPAATATLSERANAIKKPFFHALSNNPSFLSKKMPTFLIHLFVHFFLLLVYSYYAAFTGSHCCAQKIGEIR